MTFKLCECDLCECERENERLQERDAWLRKQLDGTIECADALVLATGLAIARALAGDLRDARVALSKEPQR